MKIKFSARAFVGVLDSRFDVPDNPAMNKWEWLKIVASTIAGMVAGILAEPWKQQIMIQIKRKRIYKALMNELRSYRGNMLWLRGALDDLRTAEMDEHLRGLNLKNLLEMFYDQSREAFNHYYEKEKDALFTVENWGAFVNTYRYLERNRERVLKDPKTFGDAIISASNITNEELIRRGLQPQKEDKQRKKVEWGR